MRGTVKVALADTMGPDLVPVYADAFIEITEAGVLLVQGDLETLAAFNQSQWKAAWRADYEPAPGA